TNQINKALKILEKKPIVHSMDPHNIQDILDSVTILGKILGKEFRAKEITNELERRIQSIKKINHKKKPKVLAIEWIEPFFSAGHWIPEMIESAGGINLVSKPSEHSRRINFQEISRAEPDIIIIMSCGFDTKRITSEYNKVLRENKKWKTLKAVKNNKVFAVDANSFFSKPSIRTIEGIEILAKIIHSDKFQDVRVSKEGFVELENRKRIS
ncbi:MAG: ABC transporter substrate-binding protein, partial [Nitrosopumilus sp.]